MRLFTTHIPTALFAPVTVALYLLSGGPLDAQTVMQGAGGRVRIINTDLAVLELQDPRDDLPCSVTPVKPELGFDLKFHAGYQVEVPLKELAGGENVLTILFRVTPDAGKGDPIYFAHRVRVPSLSADAKGNAQLAGSFELGEGTYKVDWLMRDRTERVCSAYWAAEAALSSRDRVIALALPPGAVQASDPEQFREEPPVERAQDETPLNVKVLVNFAPQNSLASTLRPLDTSALVSILRTIAREPRIGKFSIVAFNLNEQRVVYRQDEADRIDFPAIGEALGSLRPGTVDLAQLSRKHSDTEFLKDLILNELHSEIHPDAVIFAGPKALLDENISQDSLREIGELDYPLFYMNYNLNPQAVPWRDAISHAVKFFKGQEYTISRPRDLWFAVSEMVSRIVKSKHGRRVAASASQ
ncbi:MAG: acetyltransferase [Bryobacteraceae bacterium]